MVKIPKDRWQQIDAATLHEDILRLFDDYKVVRKLADRAKEKFENAVRARYPVPEGKRIHVNYEFGNLFFALADDNTRSATGPVTLEQLKARLLASGLLGPDKQEWHTRWPTTPSEFS
jgi:hypothetical protein